jgi:hypothetical protein
VTDAAALHAELFAEYSETTAKKVSRLEREAKELANRSLAYGEIPFQTVDAIFQFVRVRQTSCRTWKMSDTLLTVLIDDATRCATTSACCWTRAATSTTSARAAAKW